MFLNFHATFRILKSLFLPRIGPCLLILCVSLFSAVCGLLGPYLQKVFVDEVLQSPSVPEWERALYGAPFLLVCGAFVTMLLSQGASLLSVYLGTRESLGVQRQFANAMYQKSLRLRPHDLGNRSVGEVVSVFTTDIQATTAFLDQTLPLGMAIVFPMVLAPLMIHFLFQIPLLPVLTAMAVISGIIIYLSTRQSRFFYHFKKLAAERIGLVNEWIQNIRTLRILGWTDPFEEKIFEKRRHETLNRIRMVTNGQTMSSFASSVTFLLNVVVIGSIVLIYKIEISPGELLALLWVIAVFLSRPFRQLPWFFTFTLDSLTSLKRLQDFLDLPESMDSRMEPEISVNRGTHESEFAIEAENLSLELSGQVCLHPMSFRIKRGSMVAIVGEVGSGKTLLLASLVGEAPVRSTRLVVMGQDLNGAPDVEKKRHFTFVPQDGFVMSATLRENVHLAYGAPPHQDPEVHAALRDAHIDYHQDNLHHRLETEIGERGVNLSGGQKQRVALARAAFLDHPIVLLDDCLSAVDIDTEKKLLEDLFWGRWKNKTRILVTHRLSVLPHMDHIFFLEAGRLVCEGSYHDLRARSEKFKHFTEEGR